jgi:histidinol-phosphate aminotransferase
MFDLKKVIRTNIANLKPYSCARDEYKGEDAVFFDANESPYNGPYNRYPDPLQLKLKKKIAAIKGVSVDKIFLGNGSDEPIDLVYRAFCEPGTDNVVAMEPTYGMYVVCADINNVEYRRVQLTVDFKLQSDKILNACDEKTKLIFLCSPNNPSSNMMDENEIKKVIENFNGIVVLDEAYIDFAGVKGFVPLLDSYPNLIILQTFSKAWAMASVRLGIAFASDEIISILNKIKYPYNISLLTQQFVSKALDELKNKNEWVKTIIEQRSVLREALLKVPVVKEVLPSDANFLMVRVSDANAIYQYLIDKKIIVRNRSSVTLCLGCLRITVGKPEENKLLLDELKKYKG